VCASNGNIKELRKTNLNKSNVSNVKNKPGIYRIYNQNGTPVYVGSSKILKHRLQSYYQKDDFTVNTTKKALRPDAKKFTFSYMGITKAREIEKKKKSGLRHNHN